MRRCRCNRSCSCPTTERVDHAPGDEVVPFAPAPGDSRWDRDCERAPRSRTKIRHFSSIGLPGRRRLRLVRRPRARGLAGSAGVRPGEYHRMSVGGGEKSRDRPSHDAARVSEFGAAAIDRSEPWNAAAARWRRSLACGCGQNDSWPPVSARITPSVAIGSTASPHGSGPGPTTPVFLAAARSERPQVKASCVRRIWGISA